MTSLMTAEQEIDAIRNSGLDHAERVAKIAALLNDDMFCIRRVTEAGGKWHYEDGRWQLYTVTGERVTGVGSKAFAKFSAYQHARHFPAVDA